MPEKRGAAADRSIGGALRIGPRAAAVLVVGAAVAVYLPALGNGFVWDDPLILQHQLPAFGSARDLLLPPRSLPHAGSFYYRPLVFFSYLVDRWLGGGGPVAFHVTPIVLHALVSGLLLLLIWELLRRGDWLPAAFGAALFAVHPVHVEVVAWMAGRAESLAAVGVLAALLAWGRWLVHGDRRALVGGAAALFLALLAKETALAGALLGATLLWAWPGARRGAAAAGPLWLAIGAVLIGYAALRGIALNVTPGAALGIAPSLLIERLLGALGFDVLALLWPTRPGVVLTAVPIDPLTTAVGAAGAVLFAIGVAAALYARAALPAWALLWMAITLLPALLLALRYISETPVAERYLYMPSAAAAILAAWGFAHLPPRARRLVVPVAAVGLAAIALVTAQRTLLWRDEISFWSNAIALAPEEGPPYLKLAGAQLEPDPPAAERTYRAAFAARLTAEQRTIAQLNLARLLLLRGALDEMEPLARAAMAGSKAEHVATAMYLLGHAQLARGDRDAAIRLFAESARSAPASQIAAESRQALATLQQGG